MVPKSKLDYGGNNVFLEIAPNIFAWYAHLRQGSLTVNVGDLVKAGALIGKLGNTGPSEGPHLRFGLDKPDSIDGRSLCDWPDARQVRSAYPLYGGIQNYE